jgi:hypothetical protein
MARGRMVNNRICVDKRINDLNDDTSRLAFTWLVTFADREGRTYGDPALLTSMLFPRRRDVSPEKMAQYIREWEAAIDPQTGYGLVVWYEANGDQYIWFPNFEKNQQGLDRRKEPASTIPAPPESALEAAKARISSGQGADQVRTGDVPGTAEEKRKEEKRKEEKASPPSDFVADSIRAFEGNIGMIGPSQADEIRSMLVELEQKGLESWWDTAIQIAVDNNARKWSYVRGVLEGCLRTGKAPVVRRRGPPPAREPPAPKTIVVRDPLTGETRTIEGAT